jgi:hypothetical protein
VISTCDWYVDLKDIKIGNAHYYFTDIGTVDFFANFKKGVRFPLYAFKYSKLVL